MTEYLSDLEKAASRTRLYNEIYAIQRKIDAAHVLIRELKQAKAACLNDIHEWNRAIKNAMENTMVSRIEVNGKFEGATAHKYATSLPQGIKVMTLNVKKAKEFEHALGLQIHKLQDFINRSANSISALNTQISQI